MDFSLTDEQEMLRDTARTLLTKECPPSLVRAYMDDPAAGDDLWDRHLREWAVLGDGDLVDHTLFLEEAGRVVLPGAYFSTSALFLPLLRALAHPLADAVAAGESTGTVAMANKAGMWVVHDEPIHTFVIEADRVDHVAFVVPGPAVARRRGGVRDCTTDRVTRSSAPGVQRRSSSWRRRDTDRRGRAAGCDRARHGRVWPPRWSVSANGCSTTASPTPRSACSSTDRSVRSRVCSGSSSTWRRTIERAAAAVAYAAMAIDADDADRHRATHVAKAAAGRAARHSSQDGMQVHGGIGYTWEHDLHLYLRRAFASDALLGQATWHQDRLADLLLGQEADPVGEASKR